MVKVSNEITRQREINTQMKMVRKLVMFSSPNGSERVKSLE